MRIGILTFHRPCNFGANLQAYTSSRYLESLGHQVSVINYVRDADISYGKKVARVQYDAHRSFVEALPLSEEVRTPEQLRQLVLKEQIGLIVIGADAVWRSPQDEEDIFFAKWLFEDKALSSVSVISMAAAHMGAGFTKLTKEHKDSLRESLSKFKYITVRDRWTAEVVNKDIFEGVTKVDKIIPDPVFMLDKLVDAEWESQGLEAKRYIAMTLPLGWGTGRLFKPLRKLWFARFKRIANKEGYKLVELPLPEGTSGMPFDYTVPYPIDPLQWFLWIKNAKAFVGLRFHAIVSSISAGTPFFSLDTYGATGSISNYVLSLMGQRKKLIEDDKRSKIYNLLKGSGFESFRVSQFLETICPIKLFNQLDGFNLNQLSIYREKRQRIFVEALTEGIELSVDKRRQITGLKDSCTGCFACMNACPVKAITLPENGEGFYFPRVNYNTCIDCGLCDKTCPVLNKKELNTMRQAWYGWVNDDKLRKESSSGGVFGLLANEIINDGGVVYGSSFNYGDYLRLECHSSAEVGLNPLMKSKYVQSYIGDAFSIIRDDLDNGKRVLFCGTPCQVDGLLHFLKNIKQNLLTADFVCHGVPPMALLREHLSMLRIKNVENIDFRPKNRNWVDDIVIEHDGGKKYQNYWANDAYFRSFEKAGNMRRSCYNCAYCNGCRASDITLADFWGYRDYDPSIYDAKGISLVLANTEVGQTTIENLAQKVSCSLTQIDTLYAEYAYRRIRNGQNGYIIESRNSFYKDVDELGYCTAVERHCPALKKPTLYARVRGRLEKVLKNNKK